MEQDAVAIAEPGTLDAGDVTEAQDAQLLAQFGYRQELRRRLHFFQDFGIAFTYLSPVVGIYSLFVLGLGTAGPAYIWLMPIVVGGQLLVALVFAELGSSYPIAGALFQWGKNLMGPRYGWFVGWAYGWALLATIASVSTGFILYFGPLLNDVFGSSINPLDPNTVIVSTVLLMAVMTAINVAGVRLTGLVASLGVWVEVIATFGIALMLAIAGFHHGLGYLFTTQGTEHLHTNPLGVSFGGNWLFGAALVAILAHVYIFYGFESAGDVGEEVVGAGKTVPRAMIWALLAGGITSFVLVAALILAIPGGQFSSVASFSGGIPVIINTATGSHALRDIILLFICYAFLSCGTSVQAAATRVMYSYARDDAVPGSSVLRSVSHRLHTPVAAVLTSFVIASLFSLLVRATPSKNINVLFVTYPANTNALLVLVSFGVSGIYISFLMVTVAAAIARSRGWVPLGSFRLGRWAWPVNIGAIVYGALMLVNVVFPSGITSGRALLNYDWLTLLVAVFIGLVGFIYLTLFRPDLKVARHMTSSSTAANLPELVPAGIAPEASPAGGSE